MNTQNATIDGTAPSVTPLPIAPALARYSVTNSAGELERIAQEQTPLLGSICLKNQATVIYAKPNVGKTLITLHLLKQAIDQQRTIGSDCYYIAADDTPAGVLEKIGILHPYGAKILTPGLKGFEAKQLPAHLEIMIQDGTAVGKLIILDTLKKFADLMSKRDSSGFAELARRFVMKGGTIVGLAHTNKRTDKDGKPIFAGTSDILDDFDCGYTMVELPQRSNATEKVVQFDCIKSRGDVTPQVAYGYGIQQGLTYADRLESVHEKDADELGSIHASADSLKFEAVLDAIEDRIRQDGAKGKMAIARDVGKLMRVGRQTICDLIDKYEGEDPSRHRWTSRLVGHGRRQYRLLNDDDDEDIY